MRSIPMVLAVTAFMVMTAGAIPLMDHVVESLESPPRTNAPKWHVRHEKHTPEHVSNWDIVEKVDAATVLPIRIGLKQENVAKGHEILMDISSPKSPNFGKHLSTNEVIDLFAPTSSRVKAVTDWLVSAGIGAARISQSVNKQWIQFDATVGETERLLFTDYHVYEHRDTGVRNIACSEYHVPLNISEHIDYITPGIKLLSHGYGRRVSQEAARRARRRKRQVEPDMILIKDEEDREDVPPRFRLKGGCERDVTQKCIRDQYQIPPGRVAHPGNELGVFQSLGQHYHQDDLDAYFANIAPWVPKGTFPVLRSINGAEGPTDDIDEAGSEADLDFQVTIPLVWPQSTVLWQTDDEWYQRDLGRADTKYKGFFNTLFDAMDGSYCTFSAFGETGNCKRPECLDPEYPNPRRGGYKGELMCGVYEPTNVISISYSGLESDLPYSYMQRQCLEIMKLGLQGVTVVESSGDRGVGGRLPADPQGNCKGPDRRVFSPRIMSNCPYILSVGATTLLNDTHNPGKFTERATTSFASGGGFSNVFETPEWQKPFVDTYLKTTNLGFDGYVGGGDNYSNVGAEPGKLFNKAGRGYPDVSGIGDNLRVWVNGDPKQVRGTSVAVPIWASILSLINEERLALNKTPVGFVHQVLYSHPGIFTDITVGSNPGCNSPGFLASEGWDPLTGLGTPLYPKLLQVFLELP